MFVVTLPTSAASDPLAYAKRAKREGADVLEVRTDLTPHIEPFESPLPVLLSIRSDDFSALSRLKPSYVDFDMRHPALKKTVMPARTKLIVSFHDHDGTPDQESWNKIVQKMCSFKPWMTKMATSIASYKDLSTLLHLHTFLNKKSIRSTVLGMGPKAHLTRVLSPFRNLFTYTYLSEDLPAAPGQLPLAFYALLKGRKEPKIYGILGGPHVTGSLSPILQNALFLKNKVDAVYSCFPSEDFTSAFRELKKIGVAGLSVTSPFKHAAFVAAKQRSALVAKLGVANTLVARDAGFEANNTDVIGIERGYPALVAAKRISIFGAGGAAAAAIEAVRHIAPTADITVYARDIAKAQKRLSPSSVTVQGLPDAQTAVADAVIFAISEDVSLPLPKPSGPSAMAIDLRYGFRTAFLHDAEAMGYRTMDGIPMLINQALGQFELFTGKKPHADDAEYVRSILSTFV